MKCPVCNAESSGSFCAQCGAKLPAEAGDAGKTRAGGATVAASAADLDAGRSRRVSDVPEEILWEGSYSPKAMVGPLLGCALATIVLLGVAIWQGQGWVWMAALGVMLVLWLAVIGKLIANRLGVSYKLTNHMFYHRRGVLTRVTDRIELIEVHDVTYSQGLIERMVNVGQVLITSSDRTDPHFYLRGIEDVESVAKKIDDARRAEQVRRGRRIESIGMHGN